MRQGILIGAFLFLLLGLGTADYLLVERRAQSIGRMEEKVKEANPDLVTLAWEGGFDFLPVSRTEQSFLISLLPAERKHILRSVVLLRAGERVASVHWYRSPSVEEHFPVLKGKVFGLFSAKMTNLIDETVRREGTVPFDVLAFTDRGLSEERFLFARIRDELYEFHVLETQEGWVQGLLVEIARGYSG